MWDGQSLRAGVSVSGARRSGTDLGVWMRKERRKGRICRAKSCKVVKMKAWGWPRMEQESGEDGRRR